MNKAINEKNPIIKQDSQCWIQPNGDSYRLLDSGDGMKLEESAGYRFIRPEAQALWGKHLSQNEWQKTHGEFHAGSGEDGGKWQANHAQLFSGWQVNHGDILLKPRLTNFRHLGFFPEQAAIFSQIPIAQGQKVLNLFAYSGMASIYMAQRGASVVHCDASPKANAYAKENFALNNIQNIKILTEDAQKFVEREIRRGNKYDAIIMDPPKFGRGPNGEIWDIYQHLPQFLGNIMQILSENGTIGLTIYAIRTASISIAQSLQFAINQQFKNKEFHLNFGEIALIEDSTRGFILPQAHFAKIQVIN